MNKLHFSWIRPDKNQFSGEVMVFHEASETSMFSMSYIPPLQVIVF